MLEIYANKKRLQLPDDIAITMTWENPFLLQDRVPAPYSLSFTLPLTQNNLQAFGNPDRIASSGIWKEVESNAVFNLVKFISGKLVLQESEKKLKVNLVGSNLPEAVRKNLDEIEMTRYDFGTGSRFSPDFTSGWGLVYKNLIYNQATSGEDFAACPVRVKNEKWPYDDETAFGNYAADKLYLNFFNVNDGNYLMSTGATPIHAAIFPQPYIHHLLDLVFGSNLNANPFKDDAELKKLAMVTTFHKMYNDSLMSTYRGVLLDNSYFTSDVANYFYLNSFLNAFAFNESLKSLLRVFCFSLIPRSDGTWDIIHNKAIIEGTDVLDWSGKLTGTPAIAEQGAQTYTYGYESESGSNDPEGAGVEVDNINNLLLDANGEGTYRVTTTGEVYEKKLKDKVNETDPDEYTYERKKSGLAGKTSGDNAYPMTSQLAPLPMMIYEYWWENSNSAGITKGKWYVPEFGDDRGSKDYSPKIGFVRGWLNVSTGQIDSNGLPGHYPLMTPFTLSQDGSRMGNYSLAWEGDDGLIEKFHKEFKAYIEKDRMKLTGYFRLTELDLKNLDFTKKIFVRGRKFYINKIETTIRKRSIGLSKVELIEA